MMYRMLRGQVGNPFETYVARTQTFHMCPPRLKPRVRRSADYLFIGVVWWFFAISNERLTFRRPLSWFRYFRNNDGIYFYGLWLCIRSWEIKSGVSSCRSVRWANPFLPSNRMAPSSLGKADGTGQQRSDAEQTRIRPVQLSSVSHPPDGLAGPGGGWIITPTSSLSWKELRLLWSSACSVLKLFRPVMRGTMCFQDSFAVASNL